MGKQPPLAGRNDPKLQERYEQLLAAAAEEFATRGYHQTTIKDIVERAGVATGTFYLYFANKEQSCAALIERLYGRVLAEVVAARAGKRTKIEKLAASIRAALAVFGAERNLAHIALVRAPGAHPLFDELLARIQREFWDLVAEDIEEAMAEGLLPPQPAAISARALIGSLYEVVISWLQAGVPERLEDAVEPLVVYCLRGLGATPGRIPEGPGSRSSPPRVGPPPAAGPAGEGAGGASAGTSAATEPAGPAAGSLP